MWTTTASPAHRATAFVPVVDQGGFGDVALMELELELARQRAEGGSRVRWRGMTPGKRDPTLDAIEAALGAALAGEANRWQARVKRVDLDFPVSGASLGLGVAMASWAASRGLEVPSGWAFSAQVSALGEVRPVSDETLALKLCAAAWGGVRHLMLSASQGESEKELRSQAQAILTDRKDTSIDLESVRLVYVEDLVVARRTLFPRHRLAVPLLTSLCIPPLLALFGVTQIGDVLLSQWAFFAARGPLKPDQVAVLTLDGSADNARVRELHGARVREIARAGADVIVFDMVFRDCEPGDLDALIAAIEAVEVPVVVGARARAEGLDGDCDPRLFAVALPGLVNAKRGMFGMNFEDDSPVLRVGRFPVLQRWIHPMACVALAARAGEREGDLRGDRLICGESDNPVSEGHVSLVPVAASPRFDYKSPASWGDLSGKVVFVGAANEHDLFWTPLGERYGVELQAALTQTLHEGAAPTWPTRSGAALLTALFELLGLLLMWAVRGGGRGVALGVCAAGLTAGVVLGAKSGWVAPVTPFLLALLLLWWQAPRLRRLR